MSNDLDKLCGCRLDNLILEAITTLKEPSGSDRASIALYIEVCLLVLIRRSLFVCTL